MLFFLALSIRGNHMCVLNYRGAAGCRLYVNFPSLLTLLSPSILAAGLDPMRRKEILSQLGLPPFH